MTQAITFDALQCAITEGTLTKCPYCGLVFEDDNFAYALETGTCESCHEKLSYRDDIDHRIKN